MLATLIIGLREGLEAALIVGIVAAFLRKNGKTLTAMWFGVGGAVALSLAVGIGLKLVERSLPQAAQEGMETVIGAVATFFVTTMVLWMRRNARFMKKELEGSARAALSNGSTWALVAMTFLAVLKEGFESAVFLLATFSVAQNAALATGGALLGFAIAVGIGIAIYRGGIRLNLGRFFTYTSIFLVLVAAGLVLQALRTAHEAGWLLAGQQRVLDLSWLVRPGSVQAALITGMLGIPADPRLIEVLGWVGYLVPMALYLYWPANHRPVGRTASVVRAVVAGGLVAAAAVFAVATPWPSGTVPATATISTVSSGAGTASVEVAGSPTLSITLNGATRRIPLTEAGSASRDGVRTTRYEGTDAPAASLPSSLTLDDLVALNGGRLPVGVSAGANPGPFTAVWSVTSDVQLWLAEGKFLDATETASTILTLNGGGLSTSRTVTVKDGAALPAGSRLPSGWSVDEAHVSQATTALAGLASRQSAALFWKLVLPLGLVAGAGLILVLALRRRALADRAATPPRTPNSPDPTPSDLAGATASARPLRNSIHVA